LGGESRGATFIIYIRRLSYNRKRIGLELVQVAIPNTLQLSPATLTPTIYCDNASGPHNIFTDRKREQQSNGF
jgi:hypothetical protein